MLQPLDMQSHRQKVPLASDRFSSTVHKFGLAFGIIHHHPGLPDCMLWFHHRVHFFNCYVEKFSMLTILGTLNSCASADRGLIGASV